MQLNVAGFFIKMTRLRDVLCRLLLQKFSRCFGVVEQIMDFFHFFSTRIRNTIFTWLLWSFLEFAPTNEMDSAVAPHNEEKF